MAVKASAHVTLSVVAEIQACYRYYLLQSSTLATPSKPTTYPPSSSWTDAEPTYTSGSTNSLYFVDLNLYSDDTWSYSAVSKSSSYEAAKEAYNKAVAAGNTAQNAQDDIDNLEVGGRNLLLNTGASSDAHIIVSGATNAMSGITSWTNSGGVLTLNCSTSSAECYYRFMAPAECTNILYNFEPGEEYTFSGKAKVKTTSGTLSHLAARSQYYISGWNGGYNHTILTADTDDWVPFEVTQVYQANATGAYFSIQLYYTDSWDGVIELTELKIEKGNRATDWTPAPEDMATNESLGNLSTDMNDRFEDINDSMGTLEGVVSDQATVIAETVEKLADTVNEQGVIQDNFETITTTITEVDGKINAEIQERNSYIRRDDTGILLGDDGEENLQLHVSNSQITFKEEGAPVAWISGKKLYITEAEVTNTLRIGNFIFEIHGTNNNLGIRRVSS